MKIYICTQQSLRPTSSYYDVIGAYTDLQHAIDCIHSDVMDIIHAIDMGDEIDMPDWVLDDYRTRVELRSDTTGYFDIFNIHEIVLH